MELDGLDLPQFKMPCLGCNNGLAGFDHSYIGRGFLHVLVRLSSAERRGHLWTSTKIKTKRIPRDERFVTVKSVKTTHLVNLVAGLSQIVASYRSVFGGTHSHCTNTSFPSFPFAPATSQRHPGPLDQALGPTNVTCRACRACRVKYFTLRCSTGWITFKIIETLSC